MLKVKKKEPTLVLSRADMTRIKNHLEPMKDEKQERVKLANEERKRVHEMSVNQVKTWTNTVLGQRQANLKARKLKEDMEEQQRQEIDLEEAKLQAEKRRQAIEKAKTQQYFETERIRKFHSALMLSETLHERQRQIEYKDHLKQAQLDREKKEIQEYIWETDDASKAMEQQARIKEISDFQKIQIENKRIAKERENEERKSEEKELLIEREKYKEEQEKALIERKAKIELERENYARHLELKKQMEVEETKRREKENEERREFSIRKITFSKAVAQKEFEMLKQKQEQSTRMVGTFSWLTKRHVPHDDDGVQKYLEEEDKKIAKKQLEEEEKKKKMKESVRQSYHEQEENKRKWRENKLKEETESIEIEAKVFDELKKKDEAIRRRKLSEAKHLKDQHLQQIAEKRIQTEREEKEELGREQLRKSLADDDDKRFIDYSSNVIKQLELQGRNTNMLKKMIDNEIDRNHPGSLE